MPVNCNARLLLRDVAVALVCVYGYVYTAFKLGNPAFLARDFFFYKNLIGRPFDFAATQAPYALRQVPALFASLFYRLKLGYGGATVLDMAGMDADTKLRYFAFVLSSGLAACLTLVMLSVYIRHKTGRQDLALLFTAFGILSAWFWFPTLAIAPLTVTWGWVVSTLFAIAFIERSVRITAFTALLAVFTRETTLVFALAMFSAAIVLDRKAARTLIWPTVTIATACVVYLVLRKALTHGGERQLSALLTVASYADIHIVPGFMMQSVVSQTLIVVLLIAIAFKAYKPACCLVAGMLAICLLGLGVKLIQFSHVTGETLPMFALFFMLGPHLPLAADPDRDRSPATRVADGPNPSEL